MFIVASIIAGLGLIISLGFFIYYGRKRFVTPSQEKERKYDQPQRIAMGFLMIFLLATLILGVIFMGFQG